MAIAQHTQINSLTATRAVAALMVVIHHFGGAVSPFTHFPKFFHSGNVAVGYFFVLSGFVLYISYRDKVISYGDYMKMRVGRIVPIYLLALAFTIYFAVAFAGYDVHAHRSVKEMVYSALFIQAFIPGYPLTLNGPGWTISVEMFFYVLFPLLLSLQKKNIRVFIVLTVLLYLLSQWFHIPYYTRRYSLGDNIVDTVFFSPEIHLSQFLVGMTGGFIFQKIKGIAPRSIFIPIFLFAVIILLIGFRPDDLSYQTGLIAPLFMLFIISVAINDPKTLNFRPLVFLGEISYGLYILQMPVYNFLGAMNTRYMHMSSGSFFYFALGVLVAAASITYYIVELPLRKKIASLSFARKQAQ